MDELESKHKKAIKALEGEKRAAVKKAKGTKGKKAKEALAAVEEEYANKLIALEASYQTSLKELQGAEPCGDGNDGSAEVEVAGATTSESATTQQQDDDNNDEDAGLSAKEKKQAKARRKKERQKERELQRQKELEEEMKNAGPSMKKIETENLTKILEPLNLKVSEVEADGHCLYRAIGAHAQKSYQEMRSLCATSLVNNESEFAPFCEYNDTITNFEQYVSHVKDSAEWGGHLELRALSIALNRPIYVYSVNSGNKPLKIVPPTYEDNEDDDSNAIRLSYHLHYYALGEHYNQVVPK